MKTTTYTATRQQLMSVPLPIETKTYKPVSHTELISLTEASIIAAGFEIDSVRYSMAKEGNVANAVYTLKAIQDDDMQLMIAWQNSYDKSLTLKFAIGAQIFICSNGCVSGSLGWFKSKHTGEVQTRAPQAIVDYIKLAAVTFASIQKERNIMMAIRIDRRTAAELIGRLVIDEVVINPTQMNIIKREMDHPTHNYGNPGSLWELYQYVTFAIKDCHPSLWIDTHLAIHEFFVIASLDLAPRDTDDVEVIDDEISPVEGEPTNQLTIFDTIAEVEKVDEDKEWLEAPLVQINDEESPKFDIPERPLEPSDITVDADGNYLVKIQSEDFDGNEKTFNITLQADDEDDAERISRSVFSFDYPLRPIEYITINKIK